MSEKLRLLDKVMAQMRKEARPAKLVRLAGHRLPALPVGAAVQSHLVARLRALRTGNYLHAWAAEIANNIRRVATDRRVVLLDCDLDLEPAFVLSRLAVAAIVERDPGFFSADGFVVVDLAVTRGMVVRLLENGTMSYQPIGSAAGPAGSVGFQD